MITLKEIYKDIDSNNLINETINQIRFLVNEEQGISNNVINYSNKICNDIEKEIEKSEKIIIKPMVSFKKNYFDVILWNNAKIRIRWYYYNFYDKKTYLKEFDNINRIDKYTEYDPISKENIKTISITVISISGYIQNNSLFDTISHELAHYNKFEKAKKNFSHTIDYQKVIKIMNLYKRNTLIGNLVRILYFSKEYEQDGYIHGLYSWLMNYQTETMEEALKKSEIFNILIYLKNISNYLKTLNENDESFRNALEILKRFSVQTDYNRLLKKCDETIKRITKNISRTYYKARNDYHDKYHETIHEHF